MASDVTPEMREYTRCAKDPAYFIFKYCKVNIPGKGIVSMEDWLHQRQLIEIIITNDRVIILKARQLGISWLLGGGLALWFALFVPGSNVGIFSRKENDASDLLRNRCRVMLMHLPPFLQLALGKDNDIELEFPDNNSHIRAFPADADSGSSYTFNLVIMDEMAKMEHAEDLLTAILPTVEHGKLVCLSSARGMKNTFAKTYWNAKRGLNEFVPLFIPYNVLPGRDRTWWKRITSNFPGWKALQEYPSTQEEAFLTAGECLFDMYKLNDMTTETPMMGMHDCQIWRTYDPSHVYWVGVDTALGIAGGDYICAQFIDATTGEHVAKFRTQKPIEEFGDLLYDILMAYGEPKVIVEEQPVGRMVVKDLRSRGYSKHKIYHRGPERPCFHTGPTNRGEVLEGLASAVRQDKFTTFSEDTLDEFKGFGWNGDKNRFEAMSGHDDEVMSLAITWWFLNEAPPEWEEQAPTSYIGGLETDIYDVDWSKSNPMKGLEVVVCTTCGGERIAINPWTERMEKCTMCHGLGSMVYAATRD